MKQEDTKEKIRTEALRLFAQRGYEAVSVGQIAAAVGIKPPSLYNHFPGKRAIFDAIFADAAQRYDAFTAELAVHVDHADDDVPVFTQISAQMLAEKVRQIFLYSLHDETVSRFRRLLTLEQFHSPELAALYTKRYVDRLTTYHAGLFRRLIDAGVLRPEDPDTLALLYVSPILTLIGVCDRQPEMEPVCLEKLDAHVHLFFRTFNCTPDAASNNKEELQ